MKVSRKRREGAHPRRTRKPLQSPADSGARRREIRLAFLVVLVLTSIIALTPGPAAPHSLFGRDKLDHLAAFAALAVLVRAGWPRRTRLLTGGLLFVYGMGIELVQSVPLIGRTASIADLTANGLGIALGLLVAWAGGRVRKASGR